MSNDQPRSGGGRRRTPEAAREFADAQLLRWKVPAPPAETVVIGEGPLEGRKVGLDAAQSRKGFLCVLDDDPAGDWWRLRYVQQVTPYRDSGRRTEDGLRVFEIGRLPARIWPEEIASTVREEETVG